ncbi:uncharacterized protein LOC126786587 isoform X2 [Argentina anserina]|uniref:uncharacterized protein LOC126786587 isoform X2 n=1 Tax=Argentina anserina TaxID=57926 RepID=UPI00217689B2|nr:uncharacterized protein LOC126786587 isoform X2 [Potentilla anserina]
MANPRGFSVRTPAHEIRKKRAGGQRNKEELEKEVSLLQTVLNQEEKVHEVLEYAYNRKSSESASAIQIPTFIPQKAKELLAELAMVEGEISRLEDQIRKLKLGLKQEEQATKESKARQGQHDEKLSLTKRGVHHDSKGYETKALHFISKAIKGDYDLHNEHSLTQKMENLRHFSDQKENSFYEDVRVQSKVPRKGGFISAPSPSPLRASRHTSVPKLREVKQVISSDHLPPKTVPILTQQEENNQTWQPNKLSEEILKCLNLIYVRLLRTTRTMELEKSGPISRSLHSSSVVTSRSFRDDSSLNPKSSLLLQKESRQQDPYGIFNVEDSIPRDIGPYKNLVVFTSISMDPRSISASNSIPLLKKLRVLLNNLLTLDLGSLTYQQKLAFWINMYNACIMNGFLEFGAHSSADKLITFLNKATLNIGGKILNAQSIEQHILRKPAPAAPLKEALFANSMVFSPWILMSHLLCVVELVLLQR